MTTSNSSPTILYIIVIGFHHKKGCQIEFVHPIDDRIQKINVNEEALSNNSINDPAQFVQANELYRLPKKWRHLSSLALPDGSHNYESDFVYFHLEDDSYKIESTSSSDAKHKLNPNRTIFGVSCYRQINASELLIKDSEVTRNTLQKSVCILSKQPLYATIRLKLQAITNAFFEQKDFHKTEILVNAYNSLCNEKSLSLTHSHRFLNSEKSNNLIGFSLSDLVIRYQHKILVLFKLLLLQKKCLFQLNPVSNLSNTIMSLVSLIPDIFSSETGLTNCSGFFESIELVNCELERKNQPKLERNIPLTHLPTPPLLFDASLNLTNKLRKKKRLRKKILSFSSSSNGKKATNTATSISSSISSLSLKNQKTFREDVSPSPEPETVEGTNVLSVLSKGTQRLFGSNNNSEKKLTESLNEENQFYKLTEGDDNILTNSVVGTSNEIVNINHKSNKRYSPEINQNKEKSNDVTQLANLIKSKVSNVFKLVDWGSPSASSNESPASGSNLNTPSTPANTKTSNKQQTKSNQNSLLKNSKSFQNQFVECETPNKQKQSTTTASSTDNSTYSTPQQQQQQTKNQPFFQLAELLDVDFGMPFNLFNQFNILHPYLSLYYLDYFNAINKMNTKLYCTTALMMSMMKGGGLNSKSPVASPPSNQSETSDGNNESGNFTMSSNTSTPPPSSTSSNISPNTITSQDQTAPLDSTPTQYGYTIGATNILFKQRLYEELDAFIDDTDVDLKQNDYLKKQLQLTTADIRFVDYIIKNVNATRIKEQVRVVNTNDSTGTNTPTLLSFRKTLPSELNNASGQNLSNSIDDLTSSSWEGSDDWIRINFKWYLYSMIGSMLKEDICNQIKLELDTILMHLNNSEVINDTSSSSSTISLSNEVIDIDDYIEKTNNNSSDPDYVSSSNNHETTDGSQRNGSHKKINRRRKNSSGSLTSLASNYSSQYTSHMDYREDYNSSFLNEFKKTECFKEWYETNRAKLEISLFKYDKLTQQFNPTSQSPVIATTTPNDNSTANLNNRLQLLYSQLQELEKMRLMHPFNGQISVNDIKLRFNLIFTSTESGRKINKAFMEGGKLMNSTGKAVNDAFSQAKVSFNSFFNNWSLGSPSQNENGSKSSFKRSSTSNSLTPNEKSTTKM